MVYRPIIYIPHTHTRGRKGREGAAEKGGQEGEGGHAGRMEGGREREGGEGGGKA